MVLYIAGPGDKDDEMRCGVDRMNSGISVFVTSREWLVLPNEWTPVFSRILI
jgi:hypothetical protein